MTAKNCRKHSWVVASYQFGKFDYDARNLPLNFKACPVNEAEGMQAVMLHCTECGEQKPLPATTAKTVTLAVLRDSPDHEAMVVDLKDTY